MARAMDVTMVERALRRLGELLGEHHEPVEILLVGGAAGLVTRLLPRARVTTDCDVMLYLPAAAMASVERTAERVAEELGLATNWLNSDVQLRGDALPDGWDHRRIHVGDYGRLRVSAASRPDLMAMKVLAGRDQDIEDLQAMRIRIDDVVFVEGYLNTLADKGTNLEQISDARSLLASLEVHEHE